MEVCAPLCRVIGDNGKRQVIHSVSLNILINNTFFKIATVMIILIDIFVTFKNIYSVEDIINYMQLTISEMYLRSGGIS